jgi:ankyrin repeat protein
MEYLLLGSADIKAQGKVRLVDTGCLSLCRNNCIPCRFSLLQQNGDTVLKLACLEGHTEVLKLLLAARADDVRAPDPVSKTRPFCLFLSLLLSQQLQMNLYRRMEARLSCGHRGKGTRKW